LRAGPTSASTANADQAANRECGLTSLQITVSRGTPGELPQGREDNEAKD
jgi:hypothetical protein